MTRTSREHLPARAFVSPRFDRAFVLGVLAFALLAGGVPVVVPRLLPLVIAVDLWLFAYPHVASMYTRLAFAPREVQGHRLLLFGLPPLVAAATAATAWLGGVLALNTVYFIWQSWHYTRQTYGIARAFGARDRTSACVIYGFSAWGLLHRAVERPTEFFGAPLWSPGAPRWLALAVGAFALGSLAVWTLQQLRRSRDEAPINDALFVLSHVVIASVSYLVVRDITRGWLFVNVWHNLQYLLFVWAFHERRFRARAPRTLLARLSRPGNAGWYAALCLGISTAFYLGLGGWTDHLSPTAFPALLVIHQTVNFHHYVVDAIIWRSRATAA